MIDDFLLSEIKLYKDNVLSCLIHKYSMNENDARKAIQQSYLLESLIKFPEETIYIDIETTTDEIYFDYKRGNNE